MFEPLKIRPVLEQDLPMLLEWRNSPKVRNYMLTQHEITAREHFEWFARATNDGDQALLIVEDNNQSIGFAKFNKIERSDIANWGFYTKPEAPKGTGKKLTTIALSHAFGQLGVHKVCGQAIANNATSIALHQRLGFTLEGVLRNQVCVDTRRHNLLCFGLMASEWLANGNQNALPRRQYEKN